MGPQAHPPPPSAPWHLLLPKCSALPADALKIHGPYGNSLAVQWLGAFTASPGSLVSPSWHTERQTKSRRPCSKPAAPATLTALARGSTSLPGQGKSTHQRVFKGALPTPLPPLGKPAAAWCRGLFLGVEGEGNGKRDRELGRWGREAQGVFLAAISYATRDPRPLTPPLSWPLNYGAAAENWPTHRSRPFTLPAQERTRFRSGAGEEVSELEDPEKKLHPP